MESVCLSEEVHDLGKAGDSFFAGDELALHRHHDAGQAEAAAARGHHIGIVLRIFTIHVDAFRREAGDLPGTFPHIVEMGFLNIVQEFVIILEL